MITWQDAHSNEESTWKSIDSIKAEPEEVISVGFVVKESKKGIVVAMDYDASEDTCHAYGFIPKAMISARVTLTAPADPQL